MAGRLVRDGAVRERFSRAEDVGLELVHPQQTRKPLEHVRVVSDDRYNLSLYRHECQDGPLARGLDGSVLLRDEYGAWTA
jgi:hypothetical protein